MKKWRVVSDCVSFPFHVEAASELDALQVAYRILEDLDAVVEPIAGDRRPGVEAEAVGGAGGGRGSSWRPWRWLGLGRRRRSG